MTNTRTTLKSAIESVIKALHHFNPDEAADVISELSDEIAEGGREDLINGAILDGIRWGYAASVNVEMAGGAMLRVCLPGGFGITYEWGDEESALPQIKAALAMLAGARVTAYDVGE